MSAAAWKPGPPPALTRLDTAFGNIEHLPPWSAIPDDFKRMSSPWCRQVSQWFSMGPDKAWLDCLVPRDGIDASAALMAVQAVLASFQPKHEHKEAGAAYLLSLWFSDPGVQP